ncbi:hypothetical protein [Mesobacillus boroniphilus]|uniref:hypothetical protein n=1 Tax=Mesobacillus boroniphilus TaxID=308892 RepID=UPI0012E22F09|nr:hypothetical protein [Mesobacillus boroniphilus]
MKSFFDFIGQIEATRGARRWSWTKKSQKRGMECELTLFVRGNSVCGSCVNDCLRGP